jgi:hypothetical protein
MKKNTNFFFGSIVAISLLCFVYMNICTPALPTVTQPDMELNNEISADEKSTTEHPALGVLRAIVEHL